MCLRIQLSRATVKDLHSRLQYASQRHDVRLVRRTTVVIDLLVPHVPVAILLRGYAPGAVTAVLINLPVMSILAIRMLRERWVSGWKAAGFGVGVPLVMGGAIVTWVAGVTSGTL